MSQTALITGASAGIGTELAREFASHGYDLILTARRQDALDKLATELTAQFKIKVSVFAADLANPKSPLQIQEFVVQNGLVVDVLVNNAGFAANGHFASLDTTVQLEILQVNITSLVHLTRLFLPDMIARNRGGVLNVASIAAFVAGPLMAVYYASKAFVLSFSEALANEVSATNLKVSCLCPGATITEFQKRAQMQNSKLFSGPSSMDAATVARLGYEGFERNDTIVVTGTKNKFGVFASRFVPRKLAASVARSVQEV